MPLSPVPSSAHVTYRQQFRRCNKADCPGCRGGGQGHGPYWYAFWREDGRPRSRYLGKEIPAAATQAPHPAPPGPARTPVLRVRTLGSFMVWRGPAPLPATAWRRQKVAALFKCLLAAPDRRATRDVVLELLWPDEDPRTSSGKLRLTLYRLRQILGGAEGCTGYLRLDGDMLVLDAAPEGIPPGDWLDAVAFEHAASTALAGQDPAPCQAALVLYTGDYLPDDAYAEWAVGRRETLRQLYLAVLLHLAGIQERRGEHDKSLRWLRAVLAVEPGHEAAARAMMRAQVAIGQHGEALRIYRQLAETLRRELDLLPEAETQAQYQALLAARASEAARRTNLPTPLTSFVGRRHELATLEALLGPAGQPGNDEEETVACRLLTLTGAGGCGKTRLAIELGRRRLDTYVDGVWLVELASLTDMALIAQAVGRALGIAEQAGQPALATLLAGIAGRELLLILDNCEHLLHGCAALAGALLSNCPSLHLLATSREALGILGETVWRVPALATPNPRQLPALHNLATYGSVRLFVERARAGRPGFALTAGNSGAVAAICHRLDGIPLAIELAAARLATLSLDAVVAQLDDRFRLLVGGNRAAVPRHQTLRAVLDWSYALLEPAEHAVLRRLSVFAGGWSSDAATAICVSGEGAGDIDAILQHLVLKSLVQQDELAAQPRYHLLETVRQYAYQHLRASGEERDTRDRHLAWACDLAERMAPLLRGDAQSSTCTLLQIEHDNLRAALEWCGVERRHAAMGLRLATALAYFWEMQGHWAEGRGWLTGLLEQAEAATPLRITALQWLGTIALDQGDYEQARLAHEERLALARATGDEENVAGALNSLGNVRLYQGSLRQAEALYVESLAFRHKQGNQRAIAATLNNLGLVAEYEGDQARAIPLLEESLSIKRTLGDRAFYAWTLVNLADSVRLLGDLPRAQALSEELLALCEDLGDTWGTGAALYQLGQLAVLQGDTGAARERYRRGMALFGDLGDKRGLIELVEAWASWAMACEQPEPAATLLGAATAARQALHIPRDPHAEPGHAEFLQKVERLLGSSACSRAWQAGERLSLDDARAFIARQLLHEA